MMPASWRAVRPLLLPFLIVQLQYIQLPDTLAHNVPALRHEHNAVSPLYGTAREAPALCHDHAAPLAALRLT
jgi:hypothetical protein